METALTTNGSNGAALATNVLEAVTANGDLGKLSKADQAQYVMALCQSVGLNPLSRPIELMTFQGRTVPYARKDATDQLRKLNRISITIVSRIEEGDIYTVTARATTPDGRTDEDVGSVVLAGLKGENRANAIMKAHTKSKRRVTLSICGLGLLDESELDTVGVDAAPVSAAGITVEARDAQRGIIEDYALDIAACKNLDELKQVAARIAKEPKAIKDAVRAMYDAAKARLSTPATEEVSQ